MLLSQNYFCHLLVIKKEIVNAVGGFHTGVEGAQDYDLILRCIEKTNRIHHIPKVLYHWRKIPGSTASEFTHKSYANDAGKKALQKYIERNNIKAEVLNGVFPGVYRIKRTLLKKPLVSIIIPFKDKPNLLALCLNSIIKKSTYDNFEIIAISNNSVEKETYNLMHKFESVDSRIKFYEYNKPFNFSAINNYGVSLANGEHVILLNNDIEIITPDWIECLLEHSQRDNIGAVGAKLYYPNDTIQHAGVFIGIGGVAGHSHKHYAREDAGYFSRLHVIQNLCAVTAACLMVKKNLYTMVGGLDEENLSVAFNDVDFCLRLFEKGFVCVFTPYCEAYHHESVSRGMEDTPVKQLRFQKEVEYMLARHKDILKKGDPFYNPNLTIELEDFSFRASY
jgi:GT2 family glycosyltransferase